MRIMDWAIYVRLALAFSVALVDGQSCDEYIVTVKQLDFLEKLDVKLECSFNSTEQEGILWRTKATAADPFRPAYTVYPGQPELDEPEPEFVGKLDGQQGPYSHNLTITRAEGNDSYAIWQCIVNTPTCNTNQASLNMLLTAPYFNETDAIQIGNDVSCYALSDPQATMSLEGSGSGTTCVRADGDPPQPWNCSVMRTVTKKHVPVDVKCSVTYETKDESPPVVTVLIGMHWGWITFIVIAVAGVCVGGAVGGFIYYKKKTSASIE